uniref:SH3_10 domain-containing protein n=1 Tax=Echinococcus granulosus TaxID=6210 RepID=A0A068WK84_ECHGR|nr:hypothetical protein EgrG_000237800 [Echinococcus granulosus]
MNDRRDPSIFKMFKPYDQLLFECTSVLTDLCSSIWLHNIPAYSAGPQKTVLRFHAHQSTQDVPFAVLSAFKHHIENISKKGKLIMTLRKSLVWTEEHESELNRISNMFQWERGLVALANEIRMQHESVQTTIKEMEKLGTITYRVPKEENTTFKPYIFKAKAIVGVNQPGLKCVIESGQMYTVIDQKDPFVWKLAETGQEIPSIFLEPWFSGPEERLCEKVQNKLDSFKALCLTKTCQILLHKLNERQNLTNSRRPLHFPRSIISPKPQDSQVTQLPQYLRDSLVSWIEQFGTDKMSWEPVDQFWQWYQSTTVRRKDLIEAVQINLRFIEALFQMENSSLTGYYEESGFNETEILPMSQQSNGGLSSSFRWNAKLESIVNTQQEFAWKGNLHKTDASVCRKDPRTLDLPAAAAIAKTFTSKQFN